MVRRLQIFAFILCCALAPSTVRANMLDMFGVSSRSQGMGHVGTASASDFSALYYNPALLVWAPNALTLEFTYGYSDVQVLPWDRPSGYDPKHYDLRLRSRSDDTAIPSLFGMTVGFNTNLGTDFLAAGVMAYLPASGVGNLIGRFPDERQQLFTNQVHMELVGERLQTQSILFGVSFRPTDWLALGAGFSYAFNSDAVANVYTPNPTKPAEAEIALDVEQDTVLAIIAGIAVDLGKGFRVGVSVRESQGFELSGTNLIQLHGMEGTQDYLVKQPMNLFFHYAPTMVNLGVSYASKPFSLAFDGTFLRWSQYRDNMDQEAGFVDTLEFGLGGELATFGAKTRFGIRYAASPVPEQTGRTNYADNDRIMVSTGIGGKLKLLGTKVGLDLHLQGTFLPQRDHTKSVPPSLVGCAESPSFLCDEDLEMPGLQTGNPGFPGFSSGGFILTAGLTTSWLF